MTLATSTFVFHYREPTMTRPLFIPATVFVLLFACASAFAQDKDKALTVKLNEQNGSGESGTATIAVKGDKTEITIKLSGVPQGTAQPAHIHAGTCANLDPKPKIPLKNVVNGTSTTMLDMNAKEVLAGGGAINVHKSTEDLKTYVACGDLNAKAAAQ
jgi:hypothetical protein